LGDQDYDYIIIGGNNNHDATLIVGNGNDTFTTLAPCSNGHMAGALTAPRLKRRRLTIAVIVLENPCAGCLVQD
jgi:hypothetical protein